MNIDLHVHSRYSDGQFWPVDLAKSLGKAGVTIAALTDHDTFAGVPAFLDAAEREGIKGVAATEIDFCNPDFGFTSKLLGYFPAGSYARTEALLRPFQENRRHIAKATRADGGFPVLAHPGLEFDWDASRMRSKANEYTDRLRQAKAAGLWGIELHACKDQANAAEINSLVRELAHATGLCLTFGSDFHSDT